MNTLIYILSCSIAGAYPAAPVKEYISLSSCSIAGAEYMATHKDQKCICSYRTEKAEERKSTPCTNSTIDFYKPRS